MRTLSPAAEGNCNSFREMETEPADLLVNSNNSATSHATRGNEPPPGLVSNFSEESVNTSNILWDKQSREEEQSVINSVADLFLQLQQQPLSTPSSPSGSIQDDDSLTNDIAVAPPQPKKKRITTALDIAALRKSLTGRPRLKRVCHICGRECPSRHKLQRHLSTHSEDRPYNCNICGKAFKWTEYLSKHMRTQHGAAAPPIKPCVKHRPAHSPTDSLSSTEACSPKPQKTCCHSNSTNRRMMSTNSGCNTIVTTASQDKSKTSKPPGGRSQSISESTTTTTPSDILYSPTEPEISNETVNAGSQQADMNSTMNSNMMQTDPASSYHFSFPTNQYHNGYYPGFYPMNPYHPPYMNPGPYNFPMSGHPYPSAMMQNYPYDPMMHGYMMDTSMNTAATNDVLSSDIFDAIPNSSSYKSSSVSCQTADSKEQGSSNPLTTTSSTTKRSPIKIINMTHKKDIGIQCEVGDETIRALYDDDGCYRDPMDSISPGSSCMDDSDPCVMCKYPCEEEGCNRAYVHRKDLTRHMRIAHGITPTIMEPRIVEAPVKPHICNIGDCNKSYFHMKDLRRHQRQCHLSALTGSQSLEGILESGIGSLRYPCDFNGCSKSYIHKKDLIRHKRMAHNDASNHPSIPQPVVVMQIKKAKKNGDDGTSNEGRDSLLVKRSSSFENTSESCILSQSASVSSLSPSTLLADNVTSSTTVNPSSIMDTISAAVANMVSFEELSSQIFNISPSSLSTALTKEAELSATADMLLEGFSASSPSSSDFTSNSLINDTSMFPTPCE